MNKNFEEEKVKEEAKILIEKTKKMINNMNIKKNRNISNKNKKNSDDFKTFISTDVPRFNSPKLSPSRYENSLAINSNENISNADIKILNMNNNKKINELNKNIKNLEKELKLKNEIIKNL